MAVIAKVTKRSTDDGAEFFREDVPIGACYLADLDTRHQMKWLDQDTGKITVRDTILLLGIHSNYNLGRLIGYVPVELLEISEQKVDA